MPRIKKLTDYTYSPTNPASEDAIRSQIDDSIQEVYDASAKNTDTVNLTGAQTISDVKTFTDGIKVPVASAVDNPIRKDTFETHKTSSDHDGRYYTETEVNALLLANQLGNHTGTWQGLTPTFADPGIAGVVEGHTTQLAENENQLINIENTLSELAINQIGDFEYDGLVYPVGFPSENLPFKLYRDVDNQIKHDFYFDMLEITAGHIWVDGYEGNDANDGLTTSTPVALFTVAVTKANALPQDTVVIHLKGNLYDQSRFSATLTYTLTKDIIIKSEAPRGKTVITNAVRPSSLTWTLDGTSYKCTRSTASKVYDVSISVTNDLPLEFTLKTSVAEVQAEENTWYTDGTTVWVHRVSNAIPTNNDIAIIYSVNMPLLFNLAGHKLITRNLQFLNKTSGDDALSVHDTVGTAGGEYWAENCAYALSVTRNGLSTLGVGKTYTFNCIAFGNFLDGFNYHAQTIDIANVEFMFEYRNISYDSGELGGTNSNATTAHDGYTTLRVGCVGHDSYGPVLADVNSCFSVCFDCVMYDSLRTAGPDKAAFDFSSLLGVKVGKAYLINCQGGGIDTYSITADASLPVYVRNFKGKNIYDTTIVSFY